MKNKGMCTIKLKKPITLSFILLEHESLLKPYKELIQEKITCINFIANNECRTRIDFLSNDKVVLNLYAYDKFSVFNSSNSQYEIKDATEYNFNHNTIKPTIICKYIKKLIENLKDDEIIRISQYTNHNVLMSNISICHGIAHANEYRIDYQLLGYSSFDNDIKKLPNYVPWYGFPMNNIWLMLINETGYYQEVLLKIMSYYVTETENGAYEIFFRLETGDLYYTDFKLNVLPVVEALKNGIKELQSPTDVYCSIETCLDMLYDKQVCGLIIKLNKREVSLGVVKVKNKKVIRNNMFFNYIYRFQLLNQPVIDNAKRYKFDKLLKLPIE